MPGDAGEMLLLVPNDCEESARARRVLDRLVREDNPIVNVEFIDVRQSMRNGGGPACLRLRVVLSEDELAHMHQGVRFTEPLHDQLAEWVHRNYRESLSVADLADPTLVEETNRAFLELEDILQLSLVSSDE